MKDWTQITFIKENVMDKLNGLKSNKSCGIDERYPKFLHQVREEIWVVSARIFAKSM